MLFWLEHRVCLMFVCMCVCVLWGMCVVEVCVCGGGSYMHTSFIYEDDLLMPSSSIIDPLNW